RVCPALEVLSAAPEPISIKMLSSIFQWNTHEERKFMRSMGSLFVIENGYVQPFHKSVMEWLTNEEKTDPYFISILEGHKIIAHYEWSEYLKGKSSWSPYMVSYLPIHLCFSQKINEL